MVEDSVIVDITKTNYELLCDLETLMGLSCIVVLLELVHGLSKFAKANKPSFVILFII